MIVGKNCLKTTETEDVITIKLEKHDFLANGEDLCDANIELTDQDGIIKTSNNREVRILVEGAGTLGGFVSENYLRLRHLIRQSTAHTMSKHLLSYV